VVLPKAALVATPNALSLSVGPGASSFVDVTISNTATNAASAPVPLPSTSGTIISWVTPSPLAAIAAGGSEKLTMSFAVPAGTQLHVLPSSKGPICSWNCIYALAALTLSHHMLEKDWLFPWSSCLFIDIFDAFFIAATAIGTTFTGSIDLSDGAGASISISYSVVATSGQLGNLFVTVVDEAYFFTNYTQLGFTRPPTLRDLNISATVTLTGQVTMPGFFVSRPRRDKHSSIRELATVCVFPCVPPLPGLAPMVVAFLVWWHAHHWIEDLMNGCHTRNKCPVLNAN
jgi:hypothetical protein